MVPFSVVYQGDLRCLAEHGPSQAMLITDAPVDNQGKGASFSPTDLVAAGLGVCMATVMGIVARRDGLRIDGASARVEKHMRPDPPRRIGRIVVAFTMPAALAPADREKLERAALSCPVALSIHPDIVQDVSFTYR